MNNDIPSIPKRVGAIKFGLLSPREVRKMSVTAIITADTYDDDGYPIDMGLMDLRLGVIDPGLKCKTCGSRAGECPGHFGHIDLVAPVIHVGFNKTIRKTLRSVCRNCSRLLLDASKKQEFLDQLSTAKEMGHLPDSIINEVFKEARKSKSCPYCSTDQLEIKFEKPSDYVEDGHKLTPTEIRDRFENIPDEDVKVLGMDPSSARPEWMILTVLPVPPVTVRPSITLESGQRSEDDLTHKLVDIIRINQRFQENRDAGAPQLIIEDLWELLQYHVTTFFDNEVSGVPPARHRSGRPLKTLTQRLKGKEGRFRGSLSGKRVNFSARTVVSPDPNLSINEVGVPFAIAKQMTIPEKVTSRNLELLRMYVQRGKEVHPGANYAIRDDGRRIRVSEINKEELAEKIEVGWTVERQLMDGDIVLFNRQPSLHKMSIMAHRVKVLPFKTFRLNPAVCAPYNADFDGDEMNMHVLQTEESRAEASILMQVQENILSPRFGGPIIGGIHDHISGLFLLTRNENAITKNAALELLRKSDIRVLPEPASYSEDGEPLWNGKQIFSQILPKGLYLEFPAQACFKCDTCKKRDCEYNAYVVIEDGEMLQGTIDEQSIGAFKGKILDKVVKEYSPEAGANFVDDFTRLAIRGVMKTGLSFGISDEDIPTTAKIQIGNLLNEAEERVSKLIEAYEAKELEPLPGRTLQETIEMKIMQELGKARDQTGNIAGQQLGLENSAVLMAKSGARGSMLNLTQMAACVGQQAVRGERIRRGYAGRTLPHFDKGDLGADAHGFVKASYKSGLNPTEYFFHAIGGREGLVDTAVRTSQSGYLQRRLVNALQDLEVQYDGSVRETRGVIVQFKYGEDGIDSTKSDYSKPEAIHRIVRRVTGKEVN
ncbi:DNA-directed RNA polymerase subunit A' [Methanolobus profundi]|uniref:DNA-directed RNA polymerase subunit Rpo1N n=1 Tax=Methanolobus profundi TaxID=487685 RepID=A0A1I4UTM9_9EURY|nr:DNA-directed RNA polymerase subunit A' [Methanolobus profundi]SFM92278.1 DNA-directed RNA polymerase, subunit A' [Methanolobus profundi]